MLLLFIVAIKRIELLSHPHPRFVIPFFFFSLGTYLEGLIVYATIYGHLPSPAIVLSGEVANLFSNARRMTPSEHIQEYVSVFIYIYIYVCVCVCSLFVSCLFELID